MTSICRSLQCLIFTLKWAEVVSCLGSLVQSCCREGGALQTALGCVGSTRCVPATLGFPRSRVSVLFLSTLLRLPAALYGAGPALHVAPVFGFFTKAQTRLGLRFVPSMARAAQAARSLIGTLSTGAVRLFPSAVPASVSAHASRVRLVSVLRSWSLASPSWRMSTFQNLRESLVRNWRPVCSVGGDAVSGAEFAPFPSPCLLPPAGGGPVRSRLALLWDRSVLPLFCESARSVFRLVNYLSLSCYPTVYVAISV